MPNLVQGANSQHQSSELVTKIHVESIMKQRITMKELESGGNTQNDLNKIHQSVIQSKNKTALTEGLEAIPQDMKHIIEQTTDTGAGT